MNDLERITGVPAYAPKFDNLGTNVETYSSKLKEKEKLKLNRIQHADVDILTAPTALITSTSPTALGEKEPLVNNVLGFKNQYKIGEPKKPNFGYRRISVHDYYTEMNFQVTKIRDEGRYNRVKIYISLKDINDKKYSVFLAGAATNCWTELYRGAKNNEQVLDIINTFKNRFGKNCLVGRLHYKAPKNVKTEDFHRKLLKHAIVCLYACDDTFRIQFYLLGEYYDVDLHKPISIQQEKFYELAGMYRQDMDQFDDDELEMTDDEY